ncbi:histidine kinase [Corynebacterium sp.]|uniref:sensor histidine kinase n=1 Tax=Corynebacterium sp. TaxID=1720 RepID=UPI0028A89149|nr:histidine kinase [Corynebacterium sp.]
MNPTVLQSVTSPRRTWRELGAGAKLAVYTRLSMHSAIIGIGVVAIVLPLLNLNPDVSLSGRQQMLIISLALVLMAVTVVITESRPEFNTRTRPQTRRLLPAAAVLSFAVWGTGLLMYLLGDGSMALTGIFLVLVAITLAPLGVLPWLRWPWPVTLVLTTVTAVLMWSDLMWWPMFWGTLLLCTSTLSAWTVNIAKQLDRARLTESALQVSEERLRFSQELHDTLGQRLAAMSVKAELARALAKRGDDRLDGELAELQELARTSVTEMHEVVDGYRAVNLSTEVEGARQLLDSAGVHLEVDGDPTELSAPMRELSAWLVREGTTNVVRHSSATRVRLAFASGETESVCMSNDGVTRGIERLSGLAGIRRRAEPLGAELVAERDGSLFHVTLTLKE